MQTPLVLHAPGNGEGVPVPLGLAGWPTVIEGKPVHYRRKEVLRAGEWTHRGTGERFSVDRDRMDKWVRSFNARLANGIKPFVPDHHTESPKAGENNGFVVGLARDGDSLYTDLQLIGDESLELAAKNDVSVYVKAEGLDAKGNNYGEHLHHVALTPNPNQPHLGPFVVIAADASGKSAAVPVFELDCGSGAGGFKGGNTCAKGGGAEGSKAKRSAPAVNSKWVQNGKTWTVTHADNEFANIESGRDQRTVPVRAFGITYKPAATSLSGESPMNEQQLTSIGEIIGAEDLTDETAIPRLLEWGKQNKEAATKVTALSADVVKLTKERDEAKADASAKTLALSAAQVKEPNALSLSLICESFKTKREAAIASGVISEAGCNAIDALLMPAGKPSGIALALSGDGVAARPLYTRLMEVIAGNPGVKTNDPVKRADATAIPALSADGDDKPLTLDRAKELDRIAGTNLAAQFAK